MKLDRRRFLGSSVGVAAAAGVTAEWVWPKHTVSFLRPRSSVAVLNAAEYSEKHRGAPSGWFAAVPATGAGAVHSSKTKLGGRLAGSCEHELDSDWRRGAMLPPSWRRAGCDWRGPWTSTRHRTRSAGGRSQAASRGTADRVRGSQPRRAQKSEAESQLQRSRRTLAAACCSRIRFCCFNAQSEDPSLGRGHAELEEHVRRCAGHEVRLAEESTALERYSRKHPRHLCDRSDSLRDRRRYYRNGRQRTSSRKRPPTGKDCIGG